MDSHVETGVWLCGLITFIAFYKILSIIYYFIEIWPYENDNNLDDSEILVFNEDYTEIFVINFYYNDEDSV